MMKKHLQLAAAAVFLMGMLLFAFCAHRSELIIPRFAGLLVAAAALAWGVSRSQSVTGIFGIQKFPKARLVYVPFMIFLGFALAYCYRLSLGISGTPERLTWFCVVAAMIGIAEEACFRGYIQSVIRKYEPWTACFLAAVTHTAYKTALFSFPEASFGPNLAMLFFFTFAVGLILAALRETLGSILFPVLFHATFDVVAYGDLSRAPWWVWSGA